LSKIITYTHKLVDPFNLAADEICIEDIARALAYTTRFSGHAGQYSVAEHSIRLSEMVEPRYKLQALLHDAAEAYMGDIASPLKDAIMIKGVGRDYPFSEIESDILEAVGMAFDIDMDLHITVHEGDRLLLHDEMRTLIGWGDGDIIPDIQCWEGHIAEEQFLDTFAHLRMDSESYA